MTALPALAPLTDGPLLPAPVSYPVGWTQPLTSLMPDDLDAHLARYGDRPRFTHRSGARLISALAATELDGCGGGHFPVAAKWRAHRDAGGGGVVVANDRERTRQCQGRRATAASPAPRARRVGLRRGGPRRAIARRVAA